MKIPNARKLPSGNWFIQLRIGGESISITDESEAKCQARAMAIKAGLGTQLKHKEVTLGSMIDDYITARSNVLSPSTIRGYNTIRRTRFQDIMPGDPHNIRWQAAINAEAKLCSAKTLKNAWGLINAALKDNGIETEAALPAVPKTPMPWLAPEQIPLFLTAITDSKCELPALLGLCSLRRSEIFGLKWKDVDTAAGTIQVHETVVFSDHGPVRKDTTKTETSARTVPIMIPRLRDLLAAGEEPEDPVCKGNPNTPRAQINAICRDAQLPEIGMHGLRRSFASLGYHLGLSELEIMSIGGWSDFQTVHKFYLYLSEADRQEGVDKMAAFFKNANADC